MGLAGHDSNRDLTYRIDRVAGRIASSPGEPRPVVSHSSGRLRRPWGEVADAITTVLASAGEMRVRDIHNAVESLLGESVSRSSVKHALIANCRGVSPLFHRLDFGLYRLAE